MSADSDKPADAAADETSQEDSMEWHQALAAEMVHDLLDVMGGVLGLREYPARGTDEYQNHLLHIALAHTRGGPHSPVADDLHDLYDAHSWRGLLDMMELLSWHIGRLIPSFLCDAYGNVQLSRIIRVDTDAAALLETAVHVSENNHSMDFSAALTMGEEVMRSMLKWFPHLEAAVNAAAHEDLLGVRAALSRGPGLRDPKDKEDVFRACTVLCVVHSGIITPDDVMSLHEKF